MNTKWIGAALVIFGCGGWGFSLAAAYHRQERLLKQLLRLIRLMQWELQYRLTELPELCRMAAKDCPGLLGNLFLDFARELDWNTQPDAAGCMSAALRRHDRLPPKVKRLLRQLGKILGRFDLEGQLQGMKSIQSECESVIQGLSTDREIRLRSYKTLGLCAGIALAILLL